MRNYTKNKPNNNIRNSDKLQSEKPQNHGLSKISKKNIDGKKDCNNKIPKAVLVDMHKRLGDKKFYELRFKQKHGFDAKPIKCNKTDVLDLCKQIDNLTLRNLSSIKTECNSLFKRLEKKEERKKDFYKNKRWKRAQASSEYIGSFKPIGKEPRVLHIDGTLHSVLFSHAGEENSIDLNFNPQIAHLVINKIQLLSGFKNISYGYIRDYLVAWLAEVNDTEKLVEIREQSTYNAALDMMSDFFEKYTTCPHCYDTTKCRTCVDEGFITHHMQNCIETLILAFIQIFKYRDIQTSIVEIIHVFKAITGRNLFTGDLYDCVVASFKMIVPYVADMSSSAYASISKLTDFASLTDLLSSLFTHHEAQNNVLISDWMETDLFKLCTKWYSYILYMLFTRGSCAKVPFLGDILDSTCKAGKKESQDLVQFVIKTIEFVMTKGAQWHQFGFKTTFYHSKGSYLDICKRYEQVQVDFLTKGNPTIYNIKPEEFLERCTVLKRELSEIIYTGNKESRKEIQTMYARMCTILNDLLSDDEVLKQRHAPYSLLIWGNTGIAKSSFLALCNKLLCDVHNCEYKPKFIFTKNNDERMDGYKSHMHTIIIDDVGNRHPNICPMGDPMVNCIIAIDNNIASITEQAVAEQKGKIPIKCKFMLLTANTEHLNTQVYLTYPSAVMRRFNLIIDLKLKSRYATDGMFDYKKTQVEGGDDCNCWIIRVGVYIPNPKDNSTGHVEYIQDFTDIYLFLEWMAKDSKRHFDAQQAREESLERFTKFKFGSDGKRILDDDLVVAELNGSISDQSVPLLAQAPSDYLNPFVSLKALQSHLVPLCRKTYDTIYQPSFVVKSLNNLTLVGGVAMGTTRRALLTCANTAGHVENKLILANKVTEIACDYFKESQARLFDPTVFTFKKTIGILFPEEDKIKNYLIKLTAFLTSAYFIKKYFFSTDSKVESLQEKLHTEARSSEFYRGMNRARRDDDEIYLLKRRIYELEHKKPQGNFFVKDTSKFWVDNTNILKDVDVGASSIFYKNKPEECLARIANNTVILHCTTESGKFFDIRALCLGGYVYVANYHTVKKYKITYVYIIQDVSSQASYNFGFNFDFSECIDDEPNDLTYFYLKVNRPKKSLMRLLSRGDMSDICVNGTYIRRELDGSITQRVVERIHPTTDTIRYPDGEKVLEIYEGIVSAPTEFGDCGMPMVAFTSFGPVLCGIHVTGKGSMCGSLPLSLNKVLAMNLFHGPDLTAPKMVFPSVEKKLGPERLVSHPKFLDSQSVVLRCGTLQDSFSRARSNVVRTAMAPHFEELGFEQLKFRPPMNNWRIYNNNLTQMTLKDERISLKFLAQCVSTFKQRLLTIPLSEFQMTGVIDDSANLNGMPGVDYIDKINRNSSMGFPWCKTAKKYLVPCSTDTHPDGVEFTEEINEEFKRIDYLARIGVMSQSPYSASQKDEPLPKDKCDAYGTRLFFGCAKPVVLLNRKYFLTIIRFFQRNRHETCAMVGTIAQSYQWKEIYDSFPWHDRMIAGDFSKFDKKQSVLLLQAAFDIFEFIAIRGGQYSDIDLHAMKTIRADICFAVVNFDGDLLSFLGILASGSPLTVTINSVCVTLIYLYTYTMAHPSKSTSDFFEHVVLKDYGDDSLASVSPQCHWFDHTVIERECENIGMKYTMADKHAKSVPFVSIKDVTFLKRRFVWDDENSIMMAPLEQSNIVNSLMVWVESKNLCPEEQALASMNSSIREWFFHGRTLYNKYKDIYLRIFNEVYHREIELPEFDEVLENFHSHEPKIAQSGDDYPRGNYPIIQYGLDRGTPRNKEFPIMKNILRKLLRLTALQDDIFDSILSYIYGKCFICNRLIACQGLCSYHFRMLNNVQVFRYLNPYYRVCYGCGVFYLQEPNWYWLDALCAICLSRFVCGSCNVHNLCNTHRILAPPYRYYLSKHVGELLLDVSVSRPAPTECWIVFFQNYLRANW